jgi:restriction endonuclease S subunit
VSQFKLNPQVNTNKVFLIKRHDLDVRLDVEYYQPKHFELLTRLSASQYPVKTLKEVSKKIVDGPFGSSVKADDYVEKGIPFLRVADITHGDGTIKLDGLIYISPEKHQEISRSTVFPNDIVIAKTGATMGAASIVPETIKEANIRGDLAAVIVNDTVFANYIVNFINTKIGQDLFWRLNSGATRGRVVISNLRKYPLLIPNTEKMVEISQFVDTAKTRKNQKEHQAQELLAGIDAYLLAELGIELDVQDNSLITRMFKVQFREISSSRFDPISLDVQTKNLKKQLKGKLKSVISDMYRYPTFFDISYLEKGIKVIKGESINSIGDISPNQSFDFIDEDTHNKFNRTQIKYNDLIFTVRGLVGKVGIYKFEEGANINANVIKISLLDSVSPDFYWSYLNSSIGKKVINSLTSGQVQQTITVKDIHNISIPLIPIEKQNEIAEHIANVRNQAKQLQTEAAQILADAKAEVERMILGE